MSRLPSPINIFVFIGTAAPGDDISEERSSENVVTAVYNPNVSLSMQQQRERLPIYKHRSHILYCVEKYQTTIIVGETGTIPLLFCVSTIPYCAELVL